MIGTTRKGVSLMNTKTMTTLLRVVLLAAAVLCALTEECMDAAGGKVHFVPMAGALAITLAAAGSVKTMMGLGQETVEELNTFSKALLPTLSSEQTREDGRPVILAGGDFNDGDTITVEPWRSAGFPVIRDLMVDRGAYDKIMQAGGYVSINTGGIPDANAIPIPKPVADEAMDAAACIGCGACVAACKNGSAMLFVSAKVSQLNLLPQGKVEAARRAKAMLSKMDELGFGNCTNTRACEAECPKNISISNIARLNRDFIIAKLKD